MKMNVIKKIALPILLLVIAMNAGAQDIIDEDFLDNIEENAKTLWTENIPAFSTASTPEKYNNESAIVIGWKRNVTIDKKSRMGFLVRGERSLVFFENVRFKIKLNDRNAVKAFTEVYFRYSDKTDGFSAKIIKHDGAVTPVSLTEAVSLESIAAVPEFYKSFFDQQNSGQRRYFKVAVPDLEPGDILEYVTSTKSKLDVGGTGYVEFAPQYEICNKKYPILFNQIAMETDEKSFFKSLSLNGAPDFVKEPATDPEFFRYVFTDHERGVEKDVNFINTYQVLPLTKFQVIYSNKENVKGALIGQVGEIKKGFTKEELAKRAWEDYDLVGRSMYSYGTTVEKVVNLLWAELKKQKNVKSATPEEFINIVYYRIRNLVVNRDTYINDKTFAYIFSNLLLQKDIESDLIISVPNSVGKIANILFDEEIRYVVRVKNKFYFNCTDYSNPEDLVEELLGADAYMIGEPSKKNGQEITALRLPDASSSENIASYTVDASLAADMNEMSVSRTTSYTRVAKTKNIKSALQYIPYVLYDYRSYGGNIPSESMSDAQASEYYNATRALKERYTIAKEALVKEELEREFDKKIKYKDFSISSDGRTEKEKDLVFKEVFSLPDMVRKAGKKYLVNVASLVGSQLQIKKEERNRKNDINVGYSRALNWTINLKIPDGYTAEGIKELNTNVDNETGTYSCTAEQSNDSTVVLKIKKVYKNAKNTKDKWPLMLAFIDAAYNNSFKYILLRPKK